MKRRAIELAKELENVLTCITDDEFVMDLLNRLNNNDYIGEDLLEDEQ